jgi:hypothetical protein
LKGASAGPKECQDIRKVGCVEKVVRMSEWGAEVRKMEKKWGSKEGHKGACRKQGRVGWAWVVVVEEGGGGGGRECVLAGRGESVTQREKGSGSSTLLTFDHCAPPRAGSTHCSTETGTTKSSPPNGAEIGKKISK